MAGKGRGSRPRNQRIDIWVTPEERAEIADRAAATGMSASGLARGAGLGWEPPAKINKEAMADLMRLNEELNRLGNQLKAWLDGEPGQDALDPAAILQSLGEIRGKMASVTPRLTD